MIRRVSVIGLGKLGACMAATMAGKGLEVVGVDVLSRNVDLINRGEAPVIEPGLSELIAANRRHLRATSDYRTATHESDASFIIVPTPSDEKGGFSLRYVKAAIREIGRALKGKKTYHLVVVTSTVLPGSTQFGLLPLLEQESGKRCGEAFGLCYNPEFIALGSVIHDLLNPDFILIGESDRRAGQELEDLYKVFCDNHPPVKRMNFVNAELTKIAVNTFVTTKITFANMLAGICEELPGGNIDTVSEALGMDTRIGSRYLRGALGYGGPCFPRDNKALSFLAHMLGAPAAITEATDRMNAILLGRHSEQIRKAVGHGKTIAVLGLAYKPDTSVVEESQGLALAQSLLGNGNRVIVFDPLAMDNAKQVLKDGVEYAQSAREGLSKADAVVITNPSREFQSLRVEDFPRRSSPVLVFDCWRLLQGKLGQCGWIDYRPLGVQRHREDKSRQFASLWQ